MQASHVQPWRYAVGIDRLMLGDALFNTHWPEASELFHPTMLCYLHGMPWAIAPDVQKHIPFVIWQSRDARAQGGPPRFLAGQFSQMHVAHSVMGALGLRSPVADPARDVFSQEPLQ